MTPFLIVGVVAAVLLWFVLAPLRTGERHDVEDPLELDDARSKKRAAIAALDEMESDRDMGKLTPRDYETLRRDYEREAAAAIRDLDALKVEDDDDEALEAEIAAVRERLERASRRARRDADAP